MGTINTDEDFERVANVSNPLGWDGDSGLRIVVMNISDQFLIH